MFKDKKEKFPQKIIRDTETLKMWMIIKDTV